MTAPPPPSLSDRLVDVCLLGVAAVWGASYLAAKTATDAMPAAAVLFLRYAGSVGVCLAISGPLARVRGQRLVTGVELRLGGLLGLTQGAVLLLETHGVAHTGAADAGVLISLTIILTPLVGAALGTAVPARLYLAAGVCVAGVAAMLGANLDSSGWRGDLLILGAAVVRAGHVTLIGRLTTGPGVAIRPLNLTLVQLAVGTALAAPTGLTALRSGGVGGGGPRLVGSLVFLAAACSVFAFLAQTWAVQRTSANRASLLLGTEPVWAVAVAVVVGGEHVTALMLLGAALIVGGCWWGQAVERQVRPASDRWHRVRWSITRRAPTPS